MVDAKRYDMINSINKNDYDYHEKADIDFYRIYLSRWRGFL